jgi:hypothetical protein
MSTHAQNFGFRAWNLLFSDGHVYSAVMSDTLVRASGQLNRDLDIIGVLETLANNEPFNINTTSWVNVDDFAPINP